MSILIHGSNKGKTKRKTPNSSLKKPLAYVGDPEQCSRMDDSPDDPGISNAWDSSDSRGASGGGPSRGA